MASLLSICPRCGTKNSVSNVVYMRIDRGMGVTCEKCSLRFLVLLSDEDEKKFSWTGCIPEVEGDEDYILKSKFYPKS